MNSNLLKQTIDNLYEEYLTVWEDVCNIESPTWHKLGVDETGNYFSELAEKRGWKVESLKQEKSGNVVCITMNPDADATPITLSGHIDTVHPVGSFGAPAVKTDEENIYGPGVLDCKGGVVAAFFAMDALDRCEYRNRPVQLLLQTDEECSSMQSNKETIKYICKKAEKSVAFLNCESSGSGTMVLERKGIIRHHIKVIGKEIHSSRCVGGASAIAEAASKILKLEKFKDNDGLTCNCGMIKGGVAENTVAKSCEFSVDTRFSTKEELAFFEEKLKEIVEEIEIPGCSCIAEKTGFRPAMELTGKNVELFNKMNKIYSENDMPVLKIRKSLGGSDAADVTAYGIPCIDSIGVEGNFIHTTEEYAVKKSLKESAKRIAVAVYYI